MDLVTGHQALLAALASAPWEELLPRLSDFAAKRLWRVGWAEGRDTAPAEMEVTQIINTAIEKCLAGERAWDPAVGLETFLRGVIKSLVSSAKKSAARRKEKATGDELDSVADTNDSSAGSADDGVAEAGRFAVAAAIAECAEDDAELSDYYLCIAAEDGPTKRREIAKVLGWTVEKVSTVRTRLRRQLESRYPQLSKAAKQGRK